MKEFNTDVGLKYICFTSSSESVLICAQNNVITLTDLIDGSTSHLGEPSSELATMFLIPGSSLLYAASGKGTVCVWDVSRQLQVRRFHLDCSNVMALCVSRSNSQLVIADDERRIVIWDIRGEPKLIKESTTDYYVSSIAFSADDRWLAFRGSKDEIAIWDMTNSRTTHKLQSADAVAQTVMFLGNTHLLAAEFYYADHKVRVWDVDTESDRILLSGGSTSLTRLTALASSFDGTLIAAGGEDGKIVIWNTTTSKIAMSGWAHEGWKVASLNFSPDGARLATVCYRSGDDRRPEYAKVEIWSIKDGRSW